MERLIAGLALVLFIIELLVELTLNEMNMRHIQKEKGNIPDFLQDKMGPEDHGRSVEYALAKGRFDRWSGVYGTTVTLFILFGGVLPYLDRVSKNLGSPLPPSTQASGILFCFAAGFIVFLLSLPTDLYSTFVLEERFGFNKMTLKLYVADKVKGILLAIVFGVPFLFVVLWLIDAAGRYWWLWAFLFIFGVQFLIAIIYPTWIAPLFNKFEPLKEGALRERILTLANQLGFKTGGIYVMDGSRRSAHSNAYFTGFGKTKRIVLFDTLIEQMTLDQGLAVLAHEMGHYKMKHIRRMLVIRSVFLLAGLYILSLLIHYGAFFHAFGLEPSNYGALVLFGLLSGPATFYLGPLMNRLSRAYEYEADRFSVRTLRSGKPMEEALVNLTVKNLSNVSPHPWYSAYHYSHPSPAERVAAIREEQEKQSAA